MQKPASLRSALAASIPELRNEPERLKIWVEDGKVRARQTGTLGFAFEYPLSILLQEVSTDIAIITLAITRWLRVNQPDLLAAGGDTFDFETEILDNSTADILITLRLCENVAVSENQDGSFAVDYRAEPDPLLGDGLVPGGGAAVPLAEAQTVASIVADG